jgi:hypothetical protein
LPKEFTPCRFTRFGSFLAAPARACSTPSIGPTPVAFCTAMAPSSSTTRTPAIVTAHRRSTRSTTRLAPVWTITERCTAML